ncbi:auxin efflux carrier family protein [Striga asiatica]|uniref:Auxin efflux carrier family protein n=1 Tax=Striga asiatica TaxID=4170 RepID=A0A5A7QYC9_STRAF|nr:auxin efflux carrier family protein [Striga asiatica]
MLRNWIYKKQKRNTNCKREKESHKQRSRGGGGASSLCVGASEVRRVVEARRGAAGAFGSDFGGEESSGRGAKKRLCRTSRVCTVSRGSRRRTAGESDCEREARVTE